MTREEEYELWRLLFIGSVVSMSQVEHGERYSMSDREQAKSDKEKLIELGRKFLADRQEEWGLRVEEEPTQVDVRQPGNRYPLSSEFITPKDRDG